jgi:hypothetical protein
LPIVKRTSWAAEKAFGIPAPVLRCAMLIESGFNGKARSEMNAYGYAQVLKQTVAELGDVAQSEKYKAMWASYKKLEPSAAITEDAVRKKSTVPSSMGAMALYLRQLLSDYVAKECPDCHSKDESFTRKEVYLLITGYNGGQGQLIRAAKKNPVQMLTSYPPPKQTREYLVKLDNCLHAGNQETFSQSKKEAMANNRLKAQIARINTAQKNRRERGTKDPNLTRSENAAKLKISEVVSNNAGYEYDYRQKECNEAYPL